MIDYKVLEKMSSEAKEMFESLLEDYKNSESGNLKFDKVFTALVGFVTPISGVLKSIDFSKENILFINEFDTDDVDEGSDSDHSNTQKTNENDNMHAGCLIDYHKLLRNAYNEAMLLKSPKVDIMHLQLAFLNLTNLDQYYVAKDMLFKFLESNLFKQAKILYENLNDKNKNIKSSYIGSEKNITKLSIMLSTGNAKPIVISGKEGVGKLSLVNELARRIEAKKVPKELLKTQILKVKYSTLLSLINKDPMLNVSNAVSEFISLSTLIAKRSGYDKVIIFIDGLKHTNQFMIEIDESLSKQVQIIATINEDIDMSLNTDGYTPRPWDNIANTLYTWDFLRVKELSKPKLLKLLKDRVKEKSKQSGIKIKPKVLEKIIDENLNRSVQGLPGVGFKIIDSLMIYKSYVTNIKKDDNLSATITLEDYENYKTLEIEEVTNIDKNYNQKKSDNLRVVEKYLNKKIIGQQNAIAALMRSLKISNLRLYEQTKPVGTFMFVGPTGVGKTETAKALAEALYGVDSDLKTHPNNYLRVDMSEFSEQHSVSKLFGAPPGYVGYDNGGMLTEFASEYEDGIILFDEIDKAHKTVLSSLLHILDEGFIKDTKTGNLISIKDHIIIMTSNHGLELLTQSKVGFGVDKSKLSRQESETVLIKNLKKELKPEFLNRFDEIIVFNNLSDKDYLKIFDKVFTPVIKNLDKRGVTLKISNKAKINVIRSANTIEYGARDLQRQITKELLDPISSKLLETSDPSNITIGVNKNKITVS